MIKLSFFLFLYFIFFPQQVYGIKSKIFGGKLIVPILEKVKTINPLKLKYFDEYFAASNMFECMVIKVKNGYSFNEDLFKKVIIKNKKIFFELKSSIRFANGMLLNAKVFKNHISKLVKARFIKKVNVKQLGKYKFTITLGYFYDLDDFMKDLSKIETAIFIKSKGKIWGTGAFYAKKIKRNFLILSRNVYYHKGISYLDEVVFKKVNNFDNKFYYNLIDFTYYEPKRTQIYKTIETPFYFSIEICTNIKFLSPEAIFDKSLLKFFPFKAKAVSFKSSFGKVAIPLSDIVVYYGFTYLKELAKGIRDVVKMVSPESKVLLTENKLSLKFSNNYIKLIRLYTLSAVTFNECNNIFNLFNFKITFYAPVDLQGFRLNSFGFVDLSWVWKGK